MLRNVPCSTCVYECILQPYWNKGHKLEFLSKQFFTHQFQIASQVLLNSWIRDFQKFEYLDMLL